MADLVSLVRNAGVVGAGGAGFPTWRKISAQVDTVIANGAECEPLFVKDLTLMHHYAEEIIHGLRLVKEQTGARRAIFGIKGKHRELIKQLKPLLKEHGIELYLMDDVYPAGDEVELVFEATGRRIPPGKLPLDVGVVVNNVESLYHIHRASQEIPVTHSMICIVGAVKSPAAFWAPLGMSLAQALEIAGGPSIEDFAVIDGGAMMGRVAVDLETPITKTSSGFIVLPADHPLIYKKTRPRQVYKRIGKSACDQCSDCTELCPRYLLGLPVKPHLAMRALQFTGPQNEVLNKWALLCSACNLCSLYSCPENLDPRNICVSAKEELAAQNIRWEIEELANVTRDPSPLRNYRKVPTQRLLRKLGLREYDHQSVNFIDEVPDPQKVVVPLKQHIGESNSPKVRPEQLVTQGTILGDVNPNALGAPVHAPISGLITKVTDQSVTIEQVV